MQIISIVTALPPSIDGVGDYALALARLIRKEFHVDTHFVVANPDWTNEARVGDFRVSKLSSRSSSELFNLLRSESKNAASVLLHYSGYGYARRGCPFWLVEALSKWRIEESESSLITMFHELYASGQPWTSSFWLSPLQRNLAARLVRLSDRSLTSLTLNADVVRAMGDGKTAQPITLPVCSNIGEPQFALPLAERSRRMVVFGTRGRRLEVYERSAADLNRICRQLDIEQIVDIGRSVDFDISRVVDVPVTSTGELAGPEVSSLLLDSIAGVLDYPEYLLGKSSIFAAYCSHRLMPVIAAHNAPRPADGLEAGKHYLLANARAESLSLAERQLVADNAYEWYQTHSLSVHAKAFAACLASKGHRSESTVDAKS